MERGSWEGFLSGVSVTDPVTSAGVGLGMVGVAIVAALIPAPRAMRRDPPEALDSE